MFESLDSGLSPSVISLLSGGMHYACEKAATLDALERLMLLENGDMKSCDDEALAEVWILHLSPLPHCVRESIATRVRHRRAHTEAAHP